MYAPVNAFQSSHLEVMYETYSPATDCPGVKLVAAPHSEHGQMPIYHHTTGVGQKQIKNDTKKCCFASSIISDKTDNLTGMNQILVDIDCHFIAESFLYVFYFDIHLRTV